MYIRYSQPPADLFDWYEEYLQDDEEVEAKAGGGVVRFGICLGNSDARSKIHKSYLFSLVHTAGHDHWSNVAPISGQVGMVFHAISAHSRAHTEAD